MVWTQDSPTTLSSPPELQIAARLQLSGLYSSDNLSELLLVINRHTSLINEWLQDNRGHEHSSEYSQEYTHDDDDYIYSFCRTSYHHNKATL